MAQILTPIADLLDRGEGVQDLQASFVAATDTEIQFFGDGNHILFVNISAAGPVVATLQAQPDPFGRGGAGVNDEAISVPTGETGFFPFMAPAMFGNAGLVTVVLSLTANVTLGLYRLGKRT